MVKGFKDNSGNFRPTSSKSDKSRREKALRTAGIPIDEFDTSFLRTSAGDRLLAERVEKERLEKIELEKEERRVDRVELAIRDLELKFGDQLILGITNPLNDSEWVELTNLLVEEREAEFDDTRVFPKKIQKRIEDLMNRLAFNDQEALRGIQSDGGLRKLSLEEHRKAKQEFQDEINKGEIDLEGEVTPHLSVEEYKLLSPSQKLLGDDGEITTKNAVDDTLGLTPDEVEVFEEDSEKSFRETAQESLFFYRPYFGDLDIGDVVNG